MQEKTLTLLESLNKQKMVVTLKKGTSSSQIKSLLEKLKEARKKRGIDAFKYCGKLILKNNPLTIQKQMRDEWR